MKRLIAVMLCCILLVLCFAACGEVVPAPADPVSSSAPSGEPDKPSKPDSTAKPDSPSKPDKPDGPDAPVKPDGPAQSGGGPLTPGAENSVAGVCTFGLRRLITTDIVSCCYGGIQRYKLYNDPDRIYVDAVFDWVGGGDHAISAYEAMQATATAPDGTEYEGSIVAVAADTEGHPNADLSMFEEMQPGEHKVVHAVFLVSAAAPSLSMEFTVGNSVYTCEYTLGDIVTTAQELKAGDMLESDSATLVFNGIGYADTLYPDNAGAGSYYYISIQGVDEAISTFLYARCTLTSKLPAEQEGMYFMNMFAKYGSDYRTYFDSQDYSSVYYSGTSSDGIPAFESVIAAGGTYDVYYLMATLEENTTRPLTLFLEFDGREYVYREN